MHIAKPCSKRLTVARFSAKLITLNAGRLQSHDK